jgi:hypothetical protein
VRDMNLGLFLVAFFRQPVHRKSEAQAWVVALDV